MLGDTVLLSSTLELVAKRFPGAEVTALVPASFASVLEHHPRLKEIWTYGSFLGLAWKIRRAKFDLHLNLHAAPDHDEWLARLGGSRQILTHIQGRGAAAKYGRRPNALEWDSYFLQAALGDTERLMPPPPRIHLTSEELGWAGDFLRRRGVERALFLGLGASRLTKRWPEAHFARLAELARDRGDFTPVIVVGPGEDEEAFAGRVLNELRVKGFRPNLDGKGKGGLVFEHGLSIRQLAALLASVRCYVGNDSGPKHLAAAAGVPTVTLFGPENPDEWHPYDRERHPLFFLPGLACRAEDDGRWCGVTECKVEKHRCMRDIDPLEVWHAVVKVAG